MHWLVIIVLAVFVIRQGLALKRIEDRLNAALRATDEYRRKASGRAETSRPAQMRSGTPWQARPRPTPCAGIRPSRAGPR